MKVLNSDIQRMHDLSRAKLWQIIQFSFVTKNLHMTIYTS